MKMTGAQIIIETLIEQQTDTVFGYPGGAILNIYDALYRYDNDFSKYFKIFVDFDNEMDRSEITENGIARFIAYQCEKNNFKHFTYEAVQCIIKQSTKIVGNKNKLS